MFEQVSSPATNLLTVEEAQAQRGGHSSSAAVTESRDMDVEEGPAAAREIGIASCRERV